MRYREEPSQTELLDTVQSILVAGRLCQVAARPAAPVSLPPVRPTTTVPSCGVERRALTHLHCSKTLILAHRTIYQISSMDT